VTTVAQNTSGSNWDIIGNGQTYNVTIYSFLARKGSLDAADGDKGRYESGISITVPVGAPGTPNPSNMASVSVTGPGIDGTATSVQIQATSSSGSEVDGWWTGPASFAASGQYSATVTAGVDQNGAQECTTTACPFPAL
jgi:hypothetical protein